ncbi:MAG: 3-methyl-2-oxobutanoate hydroxymethyltransferase [Fimbriimonadaceae bacterium]
MGKKRTAPGLMDLKGKERVVCLTAYDVMSAEMAEAAGVDLVLVGDSLGNVILGYETTLPVELEDVGYHVRAVKRGLKEALLIADLPFGSYQCSTEQAVESAVYLMKCGAEGVKLEGDYPEAIAACVKAGIPMMGHVGFTPQSVNGFGGFKVQGRDDGDEILEVAQRLDEAGAFGIVLEMMPSVLAERITASVGCLTIGIGGGVKCDGEIQVWHDVLGLSAKQYKHAKAFVSGRELFIEGIGKYVVDVRNGNFPGEENSF